MLGDLAYQRLAVQVDLDGAQQIGHAALVKAYVQDRTHDLYYRTDIVCHKVSSCFGKEICSAPKADQAVFLPILGDASFALQPKPSAISL